MMTPRVLERGEQRRWNTSKQYSEVRVRGTKVRKPHKGELARCYPKKTKSVSDRVGVGPRRKSRRRWPAKEIATALAREENHDGIGPRRKTTHGKSSLLRQIVFAKKKKPETGSEDASSEAVVTRLASALAGEEKRQHGV